MLEYLNISYRDGDKSDTVFMPKKYRIKRETEFTKLYFKV